MVYRSESFALACGWYCFKFPSEADDESILNNEWCWGPYRLVLQRWDINFDPVRAQVAVQKVSAILLGLPLLFWNELDLKEIGDKIG